MKTIKHGLADRSRQTGCLSFLVPKNHVPTLNICAYRSAAELLQQRFKRFHRQDISATHVDAAEKCDPGRHSNTLARFVLLSQRRFCCHSGPKISLKSTLRNPDLFITPISGKGQHFLTSIDSYRPTFNSSKNQIPGGIDHETTQIHCNSNTGCQPLRRL